MSSTAADVSLKVLLISIILSNVFSKSNTLECFSTLCTEYASRENCKVCSEHLLTKNSRQLWANYLLTLSQMEFNAIDSTPYKKYKDTPMCCELSQRKSDDNRFCMSLNTNKHLKYPNQQYFQLR